MELHLSLTEAQIMSDASDSIGGNLLAALQNAQMQSILPDLINLTQQWVNGEIDDDQYSRQLALYRMALG